MKEMKGFSAGKKLPLIVLIALAVVIWRMNISSGWLYKYTPVISILTSVILWGILSLASFAIIEEDRVIGEYRFLTGRISKKNGPELAEIDSYQAYELQRNENNVGDSKGGLKKRLHNKVSFGHIIISLVVIGLAGGVYYLENTIYYTPFPMRLGLYMVYIAYLVGLSRRNTDYKFPTLYNGFFLSLTGALVFEYDTFLKNTNLIICVIFMYIIYSKVIKQGIKRDFIFSQLVSLSSIILGGIALYPFIEREGTIELYVFVIGGCAWLLLFLLQVILVSQCLPYYIIRNSEGNKIGYYRESTKVITRRYGQDLEGLAYSLDYYRAVRNEGGGDNGQ